MSLEGVGFGEGEGRFPSMISLKLLFPTFLASWGRKREKSASDHDVNKMNITHMCLETDEHVCSGSMNPCCTSISTTLSLFLIFH